MKQRIIKFRAFLRDKKMKYFSFKDIKGDDCFGYVESGDKDLLTCIECRDEEQHNVMQYTGLKDKNGEEIYESDIVKITIAGFMNAEYQITEGVVEYHEGSFMVDGRVFWRFTDCEVIGNIFENPELLK